MAADLPKARLRDCFRTFTFAAMPFLLGRGIPSKTAKGDCKGKTAVRQQPHGGTISDARLTACKNRTAAQSGFQRAKLPSGLPVRRYHPHTSDQEPTVNLPTSEAISGESCLTLLPPIPSSHHRSHTKLFNPHPESIAPR